MIVLFRTDASLQIGTGHVMRCLTLANGLRENGACCRFICREHPGNLIDYIRQQGFEVAALPMPKDQQPTGAEAVALALAHAAWLGCDWATDATQTKVGAGGTENDWLVVDHYALDARWEGAMRSVAKRIMVIDDLADRQHDCDVLLDQNYYSGMQTRYVGKVPKHCRLMIGPRYALLREEFRQLRDQNNKPRTGEIRRILVFFGGVDPDNYTGLALEALAGLGVEGIAVDVVIGAQHPAREEIGRVCAARGYCCHIQTSRMAELMAEADLGIGAGGSAIWERCCLGLPALCICVADNQRRQIADAAEQGLLYSLSTGGDLTSALQHNIGSILENKPLRKLISRVAMKEVDGLGINRVVTALGANDIEIRIANESDSAKLFEWRNHQTIREVSKNAAPIAWADHQVWFAEVQVKKNMMLLIGEIDNEPVGVVRFDQEGETALVSIYLVPEGGFKGQGRGLLLRAEEWLKTHRADIKSIRAEVLGGNSASQRLFMGADYRLESMHYLKELRKR